MDTGYMNQRIEIFANANTNDGYGGSIPNIEPYWSTNAEVRQLSSSRNLEANQDELKPVWKFRVRYRNDKNLLDDMIVKWRGSNFIIQGYSPDVVYKEYMEFKAIPFRLEDLVQGSQTAITQYGWFDTKPDVNTIVFSNNKTVASGLPDLSIDFGEAAQGKYLAFSQPSTEQLFTTWTNNLTFNYGQIPDSVFEAGVLVGGNRITITRNPFVFENGNYNINFGI